MTEEGFVKISRKILNWGWFRDINTTHLFIYCLIRANYRDVEWKGIKLKRGSFVTSLKHLSEETGLSQREVRTALEHLISTNEVTKRTSAKNTVIIVNNYEKYQSSDKGGGTKTAKYRQGTDKAPAKYRQGGDKVATTDKKKKKYSHPNRDENTGAAPGRSDGAGLDAQRKPVMTVEEIRAFAATVPGSDDYLACDFRRGFIKSGTMVPADWQEVYLRFAAAGKDRQREFLDLLEKGAYRDKWGCVD